MYSEMALEIGQSGQVPFIEPSEMTQEAISGASEQSNIKRMTKLLSIYDKYAVIPFISPFPELTGILHPDFSFSTNMPPNHP